MTSKEIREKFLAFFEKRGHAIIPSASLVPENDPTVLFNTAGMQPLIPYLLGESHPQGKRLVNLQKCVRTVDIDGIGDNTHATFLEMMGNWSLGDPARTTPAQQGHFGGDDVQSGGYWKKEAIEWSYEFLTSLTEGLGLNPERIFVTCFEGDENAPRDLESATIWREIFDKNNVKGERIYYRPAEKNWWDVGDNGPCGPDSEMFYDLTGELTRGMTLEEYLKADDSQKIVEIWNDVFMEYLKKDGKVVGKLASRNVDTGSGFERIVMAVQGKTNLFDTDLFAGAIAHIRKYSTVGNILSERIVADHIRTAVFIIAEGVTPANTDRGYILRRLLRRAVRHADILNLKPDPEKNLGRLPAVASVFIEVYASVYPNLALEVNKIYDEIENEEKKFRKTLALGLKKLEKIIAETDNTYQKHIISGQDSFVLFGTFGFPLELTKEIALEKSFSVDEEGFREELSKHQGLSRKGAGERFKGGLGGTGEIETKYHTATHLLHQALRDVLGETVSQKGSNITKERLRFDFAFDRKMTDEEKRKVEDMVNEKIKDNLPMKKVVMKKAEAEKTGALHFFGDKYGDEVDVYYIGETLEKAYSKEFCGGPHAENTGVLGKFKIIKEESISTGTRRIKAVLE